MWTSTTNIADSEVELFRQSLAVEFASNEELTHYVQELKEALTKPDTGKTTQAWIETRLKRLDNQMRIRFLQKSGAVA